jgi:pyruvate,water dikinase
MTAYTRWFAECLASSRAEVGGKCAGLGELLRGGFPVPPGFAVTTRAYDEFLVVAGLRERVLARLAAVDPDRPRAVADASAELRHLIESTEVPAIIDRAIRDAYATLARPGPPPVAVRSSATAEDLAGASFAGQQDTYLGVRGADDVVRHVVRCWSSLFTPQALVYRARVGHAAVEPRMSVGVQEMVDARVSGVAFTLNPLNGDRSKIVIETCWGLGEALVQGVVTPDRYVIDKVTLEILERAIGCKEREYRLDTTGGGVIATAVPAERQTAPCLADEDVLEFARVAKRVERFHGGPRDIEWALGPGATHGEALRILQSRPETVWSVRPATPIAEASNGALDYIYLIGLGRSGDGSEDQ